MKIPLYFLYGLIILITASFQSDKACLYAGSNIEYIQTHTEKAIAAEDLNMAKYFAYKAITALEKSKTRLAECGCDQAITLISQSAENLKNATRAVTHSNSKNLLIKAMDNLIAGSEAVDQHGAHNRSYNDSVLTLNTTESIEEAGFHHRLDPEELENSIDLSLKHFKESMDKVVRTIDCKVAYNYANNILDLSEKQLLLPNLSEGKKYYNLKTKEIALQAIKEIGDCAK